MSRELADVFSEDEIAQQLLGDKKSNQLTLGGQSFAVELTGVKSRNGDMGIIVALTLSTDLTIEDLVMLAHKDWTASLDVVSKTQVLRCRGRIEELKNDVGRKTVTVCCTEVVVLDRS